LVNQYILPAGTVLYQSKKSMVTSECIAGSVYDQNLRESDPDQVGRWAPANPSSYANEVSLIICAPGTANVGDAQAGHVLPFLCERDF
jgi:hypothetical protein